MSKGDRHRPGRPACHASGQPSPPRRSPSSASSRRDLPPLRRPSRRTCACSPPPRGSRSRSSAAARCSSRSARIWRRWAATSSSTSRGRIPQPDRRHRGHRLGSAGALPATVAHGWEGIAEIRQLHRLERLAGRHRVAHGELLPERLEPPAGGRLRPAHAAVSAVLRRRIAFTLGSVWGIDRGWAVGLDGSAPAVRLPVGTYTVKVSLAPAYADMFGVAPADASATVTVHVTRGRPARPPAAVARPPQPRHRPAAAASGRDLQLSRSATMPDLIPLPAWGMGIDRQGGRDYLDFGATVWDAGPGSDGCRGLPPPRHERHGRVPVLLPERQAGRQGEGGRR